MLLKRIQYLLWLYRKGRKMFPMKPLEPIQVRYEIDARYDSVIDESYWTPEGYQPRKER